MPSQANPTGARVRAQRKLLLRRVETLGDDRVHDPVQPLRAQGWGSLGHGFGDRVLAGGVALGVVLERLDGGGEGRAPGQEVAEVGVDVVDQAPEEGQRVRARPRHSYVGGALLVAGAVGALERDQTLLGVEPSGRLVALEDPQAEALGPLGLDQVEQGRADSLTGEPGSHVQVVEPGLGHPGVAARDAARSPPPRPRRRSVAGPSATTRTSSSVCTGGGIAASLREARWMSATAAASPSWAGRSTRSSVGTTDDLEGVGQVVGVGRLVLDVLTGVGVLEPEAYGVQPLAGEPQALGEGRVGAVAEVADARVLEGGHVYPDLMGATGLEVDLQQAGEAVRLEGLVVSDAGPAAVEHRELVVGARVARDRGVDGALERVGVALDHRVVDLVDRAVAEGVLEPGVGVLRLGDHHDARGAHVEPLHDPLSLRGAAGGDPEAGARQMSHDGRALPPRRRMNGDADRLVDHHDGVVVVDDLDPFDDLRDDRQRVGLDRDRHRDHRAGQHPVALGDVARRRPGRGCRRSARRPGCARARTSAPSRRLRAPLPARPARAGCGSRPGSLRPTPTGSRSSAFARAVDLDARGRPAAGPGRRRG